MAEELLHYIWENRLFTEVLLGTQVVEVVATGQRNLSSGPDFHLAKVKVGNILWVGSVEIHAKAADWNAHRHQHDPLYDAVILHVVLEANATALNTKGQEVPTAVMELPPEVVAPLTKLQLKNGAVRCMPEMMELPDTLRWALIEPLLEVRLQRKLTELRQRSATHHLNTIFFQTLSRYLGALKNNEAMEQVARSIPYSCLKKHANNLTALEAILLGQAGLLTTPPRDEYEATLLAEYHFYRQKFALQPPEGILFRKLRLRPPSFPARRLALVAQLMHHEEELLAAITSYNQPLVTELLAMPPSQYWQEHTDFAQPTATHLGGVSRATVESLIINVVVPTAYHYAEQLADAEGKQRALAWLTKLPPEKNSITQLYAQNGLQPQHAAHSQALLELYHSYCKPYNCLSCSVATAIFRQIHAQIG